MVKDFYYILIIMTELLPIDEIHGHVSGTTKTPEEYLNDIRYRAEETVKKSLQLGFHLNYSNKSIEDVEQILEILHKDIEVSKPTPEMILSMASLYGAYVGETFIRNLGKGEWVDIPGKVSNNAAVKVDEDYIFFPTKVLKRLTDGEEDNIIALYIGAFNDHSSEKIHLSIFQKSTETAQTHKQISAYKRQALKHALRAVVLLVLAVASMYHIISQYFLN